MWETKKKLRQELDNAEKRVIFHYRRTNKTENLINKIIKTIKEEENNKTPAVYIVDKIKVSVSDGQSNN